MSSPDEFAHLAISPATQNVVDALRSAHADLCVVPARDVYDGAPADFFCVSVAVPNVEAMTAMLATVGATLDDDGRELISVSLMRAADGGGCLFAFPRLLGQRATVH